MTRFPNLLEIAAIFSISTKVYVRLGGENTEIGVQLHQPIFHPIVQNPPESAVVGSASMSHLVDRISKVNLYIVHRTI
jgi:hypothetical protein